MTEVPTAGAVAVTGGGGFIGSALLRLLDHLGIPASTLLGPPGVPVRSPPASVRSHTGDLADGQAVPGAVAGASVVVHLAGPPSVAASFHDPVGYLRAHVEGTANVVEAAHQAGVRRLVVVSSAEVYGRPRSCPVAEDAATAPRSPYGAAKVGAEAVAGAAARSGALDQVVVVRPFSVYGTGMADWSLIGSLAQQAQRGGPLEVRDPRPVRDYVHVDDVAAALVAAARVPLRGNLATFNLCSGVGRSAGGLRDDLARELGLATREGQLDGDRPADADMQWGKSAG